MTDKITADATTLMRQAQMTAAEYLHAAVESIDSEFGSGYARTHPELISSYMRTAAQDYGAMVTVKAIQSATDELIAFWRDRAV